MYASVKWHNGLVFTGTAQSGFEVPLSSGEENTGFRPLELLAVGLVGCTGMDVISILEKKRQEVLDFQVSVEILERAETYPKIWTRAKLHFVVTGRNIDPAAVERAIELSKTKYCSASGMLEKTVKLEHEFQIIEVEVA
jgi:putative redox protein